MADEHYLAQPQIGKVFSISDANFESILADDCTYTDAILACSAETGIVGKGMIVYCQNPNIAGPTAKSTLMNVSPRVMEDDQIQEFTKRGGLHEHDQSESRSLLFLSTESFLSRHDLAPGRSIRVDSATALPLSRVIVQCSSEYSHDLVADITRFLCMKRRVIREDDSLKFRFESCKKYFILRVLLCEPVKQGVIDDDTIFVWNRSDGKYESEEEDNDEEDNQLDDILEISSLLLSDFTRPMSVQQEVGSFRLNIDTKTWIDTFASSRYHSNNDRLIADDVNRVYVSMATLMSLHMMSGSWVKIWIWDGSPSHSADDACQSLDAPKMQSHIVQLFASNIISDKSTWWNIQRKTLCISPLLHFNLINDSTKQSESHCYVSIAPIRTPVPESSVDQKASMFASEVVLSLVVTPNIKKEESFNAALVRHFTTPRLLTTGDVVGIICYWKDDPSDSNDEHRSRVVYFKVTKLVSSSFENETLFVDTEHTSLYQKGFVHSFVPVLMEPVLQGVNHYKSSLIVPGHKTSQEKLEKIIRPYLSKRVNGPPFVQVLLTGLPGTGKRAICMAVSSQLNLAVQEISCFDLIGDSVAATETRIKNLFVRANDCRPCILLLRHIHAIGKDKEGQEDEPRIAATLQDCTEFIKDQSDWPLVVIATSSQPDSICSGIYASFLHEIKLESPSEQERLCMLQGISSVYSLAPDVNFEVLARRTAGFVLADFAALFTRATSIASARVTQYLTAKLHLNTKTEDPSQLFTIQQCIKSACRSGVSINFKDFQEALDALQASHADAIGAPKIPDISWKDVGGLDSVKEEILDTIQLPLLHPELFAAGLRRSGVLLYGPPGTGKTLMAKAVATECSLNFLSVKGPELINMYVGQSEQNVREVFSRAQAASPCVIFFDELDSLAPNRGRSGDSGGVMDRVVAQLLAELDGLHSTCDVFVIGATNRPDLLDPALLRPGRFDKLLYLGVSKDHHAQLSVLKALTRKFTFSADFRLEEFANKLPLNLTGADLYAMASDALLQAMRRIIQETGGNADAAEDAVIEVCLADFCVALQNLTPSVSFQELERYKQIKNTLE